MDSGRQNHTGKSAEKAGKMPPSERKTQSSFARQPDTEREKENPGNNLNQNTMEKGQVTGAGNPGIPDDDDLESNSPA